MELSKRTRRVMYIVASVIVRAYYSWNVVKLAFGEIRELWRSTLDRAAKDLAEDLDTQRFRKELRAAYDKGTFAPLTPLTLDPDYTDQTKYNRPLRYPFPSAGRTYGHPY